MLPGLVLTAVFAAAAYAGQRLPFPPFTLSDGRHPVDAMLLAILFGLVLRNALTLPTWLGPGIKYSVVSLLPFAIVLMGARLDFYDVVRVSGGALLIGVMCVSSALGLTIWLSSRTGVGQKLGILIGIGTAICGGTAIAVTAPVIEAEENDTAFAVTVITLLGLVSIFVFPLLGAALGLSQLEFGVWAGTSIHATPQVMAAGFAYGSAAGEVAVIVKLVRVLLLAPLVVAIGAWYAREKRRRQQAHVVERAGFTTLFPPFIFGFVAMAIFNTLNFLPDVTFHLHESALWAEQDVPLAMAELTTTVSAFLITMSMAGVGLGVNVRGLFRVGLKGLYVGLFASVVIAGLSLALLKIFL